MSASALMAPLPTTKKGQVFSPREMCARGSWHFGTLPTQLRRSNAISDAAKLTYSALAEMEATMGLVRPGLPRLAREIGKSRRSAIRAIHELEECGLIEVIRVENEVDQTGGGTNLYHFLLNPEFFPETRGSRTGGSAKSDTSAKNGLGGVTFPVGGSDKIVTQVKTIEIRPVEKTTLGQGLATAITKAASEIYASHPEARRDLELAAVSKSLTAILRYRKLGGSAAVAYIKNISAWHERQCQSDQWTKAEGQFAKGLDAWLDPVKGRYHFEPAGATPANENGHKRGLRVEEIE